MTLLNFSARSPALCLFWSLCIWLWLQGAAIAAPLPIDQARQHPNGVEVTVEGIITVPSGYFRSSNLDEGFAIQDGSGGIYVSTDQLTHLQMGEAVEVQGTLTDDGHGQRMIRLANWQRRDCSGQLITPQSASVQAAAAQLDGSIVMVEGVISKPLKTDAPYGDRLWLKDATGEIQIYIPRSTPINPQDPPFLKLGQTLQVTGFSSQFDGSDEVIPRQPDDIRILAE